MRASNGVVNGANKAEIRRLTVRHTGGGTGAAAIVNSDASPKVTHYSRRQSYCYWIGAVSCVGIYNDTGSSPTI